MLVWCDLHKVVSSLTSFLGAREIRVRTPIETPLEDTLYLMHCFLCCVSNTNKRSQVMDCYPVSVNVIWNPRSQVVVWNRCCNIASPHLRPAHASPSFQSTLSLLLVNFIFFPKSGSNVITPHLLKQNNSLPLLFPHNDLFIFLSSVLFRCLYTCLHLQTTCS